MWKSYITVLGTVSDCQTGCAWGYASDPSVRLAANSLVFAPTHSGHFIYISCFNIFPNRVFMVPQQSPMILDGTGSIWMLHSISETLYLISIISYRHRSFVD
jgi:hypothetical protein